MALVRSTQRYYPQQKDPRLNEDLRIAYDHIYAMQDRLGALSGQLQEAHRSLKDAHSKLAAMSTKPDPGGPSSTRIAGLYVKGTEPVNGANSISSFTGVPVLGYNPKTGQIEWYTHT